MNRLRGRKKAKEDQPRPSVESESSGPFRMFGKSKKSQEEEPKKEVDLASALPSSDDFRTSLLMTGLSARFSMLREQDDPNTKLGKASDDSVLYPKRQSRMDLNISGLGDIAEVESLRTPPFARMDSYNSSDDAASTSGSVMNRSKPIDGNNLFGGRQKIYKIAAGGASSSGLSGRALYDNDVAQSAFQKWRQSEKGKQTGEEESQEYGQEDPESVQPGSPQAEFHRRRETNSTISSGAGRDSTAATSTTSSQPGSLGKDRPPSTTTQNPVSSNAAAGDRTFLRTRRLYEQSLTQDLHDQQSSALSRIDILAKQRALGSRTPDMAPALPSPTGTAFSDRFADRRPILSKASAPNLRSFSPATVGSSQTSPADPSNRFPGSEQRTSYGTTPPLSPPISETTEERNSLPIQPNDRGKATAMGVFTRPTGPYDESRYAQRQLQLQQGRETPTNRVRAESNTSVPESHSRSSSAQRTPFEKHESTSLKPEPTVEEEASGATFLDDADADEDQRDEPKPLHLEAPKLTTARPDDHDHPAFRSSAVPTPLSLATTLSGDPLSSHEPEFDNAGPRDASPVDSPTLGPGTGLSGMVRQHLRNESTDSSIYDGAPEEKVLAARFPPGPTDVQSLDTLGVKSSPWEPNDGDWAMSLDGSELSPAQSRISTEPLSPVHDASTPRDFKSAIENERETDEFARHLADGARRVRERLNSYVESDSGKHTPTASQSESLKDLQPPPRGNTLGILKSKSSRGSLGDKHHGDRDHHTGSMTKKLLGLSTAAMTASLSPRRTSFETHEEPKQDQHRADDSSDHEGGPDGKEPVHAGLKAFRQARRELQKMKEVEVQQRYPGQGPGPVSTPGTAPPIPPPSKERTVGSHAGSRAGSRPGSRAQSRERGPPPVAYNRMPSDDSRNGMGSRAGSRAPSERDRSGSETSNNGRSRSRPARLRNGSVPYDEHHSPMGAPNGPNGAPRQVPMLRSPGLPGTDIKRSPHMPPQPYPNGNASPGRFNRPAESSHNLTVQPMPGHASGQPSPITPVSPASFGSPCPVPQRPPPTPNNGDSPMARMVRKRDISEPTFVSTTSQVPTVELDARAQHGIAMHGASSTPNLHGNAAPPLPPINPRRKNMMGGPNPPMSPTRGGESNNDDAIPPELRQKLRKAPSEGTALNSRAKSTRHNPPQPLARPPPPRAMTSNTPGGMI